MTVTTSAIARRLDPWAPPLVLMAVIFALSAQPDLNSRLGTIDLIGRKIIHMSEYGLLTFLSWRALRTIATPRAAILLAVAVAVGYAGTDEFHQHFIHGRHGTPVDVGIDAIGAGIATLLIRRRTA